MEHYLRSTSARGSKPARVREPWTRALRRALGLAPSIEVDGVRYRARSGESLRRALGPNGRGVKEYDVTFPGGERTRIRATGDRIYADVQGPVRVEHYRSLEPVISPGMRVLDLSCGTGAGSAWLTQRVGPSGSVVALDRDNEGVRFARRRYAAPNCAYELYDATSLEGEPEGSFDLAVLVYSPGPMRGRPDLLTEVLGPARRLIAPGGRLRVIAETEKVEVDERVRSALGTVSGGAPDGSLVTNEPRQSGPYVATFRATDEEE